MLKDDWENTQDYINIDDNIIKEIIHEAIGTKNLLSYEVIAKGCSNLNIKANFTSDSKKLVRIYLRQADAAYLEQKIIDLVKDKIVVPDIYKIGQYQQYNYGVHEFIEGITLRDLILHHPGQDYSGALYEAGRGLATLQHYSFPKAGCFDKNLNIKTNIGRKSYFEFAKNALRHPIVQTLLEIENITKAKEIILRFKDLLPGEDQANLTHGDYDPANILVKNIDGKWRVRAIIDWEFAFAGSWLTDVSSMLRYSGQLPEAYQENFIAAIKDAGLILPSAWQITINLLNLLALLDCLMRSIPLKQPKRCKDICFMINYITTSLHRLT